MWWTYVMRGVLILGFLFVQACTGLGHSSSNPSGMPTEGGYAGPKDASDGGGY
jgi:hypothetical protein